MSNNFDIDKTYKLLKSSQSDLKDLLEIVKKNDLTFTKDDAKFIEQLVDAIYKKNYELIRDNIFKKQFDDIVINYVIYIISDCKLAARLLNLHYQIIIGSDNFEKIKSEDLQFKFEHEKSSIDITYPNFKNDIKSIIKYRSKDANNDSQPLTAGYICEFMSKAYENMVQFPVKTEIADDKTQQLKDALINFLNLEIERLSENDGKCSNNKLGEFENLSTSILTDKEINLIDFSKSVLGVCKLRRGYNDTDKNYKIIIYKLVGVIAEFINKYTGLCRTTSLTNFEAQVRPSIESCINIKNIA